MNLKMDKNELTEDQKQIFLQNGTKPDGYSEEEMVELTRQDIEMEDKRYAQKDLLTNRNVYNHCEICQRTISKNFYLPGQRFHYKYIHASHYKRFRHSNSFGNYCYICHKSMCTKCKIGILCKNCIEYFPEAIKNKFLNLKKMWNITWFSSLFILVFSILGMISNLAPKVPSIGISNLVFIPLAYFSVLLDVLGYYFIFKYFVNTTENFLKDLKENPQQHENLIDEVNAVYTDSLPHPENIYHLKRYLLFGLVSSLLVITFLSLGDIINYL